MSKKAYFCHSEERSDVGIRNPLTVRWKNKMDATAGREPCAAGGR